MTSTSPLLSFCTPDIPLEVALHRRGTRWYIVYPRAHGMAEGWKLHAALNHPQESDSPPSSRPSSSRNPRFWLREQQRSQGSNAITLDDLLAAEPPIIKSTGIKRPIKLPKAEPVESPATMESLVEVLLKEEQLCQRCVYCGSWEYSYQGEVKYQKVGEGDDGPLYWCGVGRSSGKDHRVC